MAAFGRAPAAAFVTFVLSAGACSDDRERLRTVHENVGDLCLGSTAAGTVEIVVVFPTCLSSSCDRSLGSSCTVTVSNGEIRITSRGESETTGPSECSADCGALVARCESPPIEPGDYVVVHGEQRVSVTLPHEKSEILSGTAPFDACF